jgi:rhodanese-related sulfurtransferase
MNPDDAPFRSVDDLLADARSRLNRLTATEAAEAVAAGALLVDIRPSWQRSAVGEIPGSFVIERNHLEWRLDPGSSSRVKNARVGQKWIVLCAEGYTSSLAADALNSIGVPATDVIDGFRAWQQAGLPIVAGVTAPDTQVAAPLSEATHGVPSVQVGAEGVH